jgi:hypothetical protein
VSAADVLRRRLSGEFRMDPWGLDPDVIDISSGLARLRWDLEVSGRPVPEGPAIVVFNRRFGLSEPAIVTEALRREAGRNLRIVGLPDSPLIGPTLRRFGAVLDHPEEVASLLREGELVGVPLGLELRHRHQTGGLPAEALAPAVVSGVPVVPVVAVGREIGRKWRVVVGEALAPPERNDPLTAVRLAEHAQGAVQALLDSTMPPRFLT